MVGDGREMVRERGEAGAMVACIVGVNCKTYLC